MAEEKETKTESNGFLAVIRVRGLANIQRDTKRTLNQLKLYKKNYCTVVPNNKSYHGMVTKIKDYVTWGNIDDKSFTLLIEKKGEEYKGRLTDSRNKIKYKSFLTVKDKKIKKYFRLNSPKKGYGRKGVKASFTKGGALGNRGDKIVNLLKRMI